MHLTCTCYSADYDKKLHWTKQKRKSHISTTKIQHPEKVEKFSKIIKDVKETIQKTTFATFGRKTSENNDWFEAKSIEMTPVIKTKHAAPAEYKQEILPGAQELPGVKCSRQKMCQ